MSGTTGLALGSQARVLRAIGHQEVDCLPCFFAAEQEVEAALCAALGLHDRLDLLRRFGADTIHVPIYTETPDLTQVERAEEVDQLPWFRAQDLDLEGIVTRLHAARETGLAVLGGVWASIFTHPRRQMGEARFLMAMLDEPELVARVVERTTECYLAVNEALFSRAAHLIDVFYFGSDFGTQQSLFISADSFRHLFKPSMARLVQQAKGYGLPVMFHTCGAVSEVIPDFIEIGIDALDPVQASARDMSPQSLAPRFKGRIAFHGGISTQTTLPHGTPEQVRAEVHAAINALGPTGYLCGPDQEMIGDIPVANIVAMYEAIHAAV